MTKSDSTSPYANGYQGKTPEPMISQPDTAKLVIWLHGQYNPRKKETCSKQANLPPKSILALDKMDNTHVYYHCTAVVDAKADKPNKPDDGIHYKGYAHGSYILARRDELEGLLNQFLQMGVNAKNITIAGHSAGGWTALLAAASYPEKFENLIAFAPAFAGVRSEERLYPWWRKIARPEQVEMIIAPNDVTKLIFAYEDDAYNRPQELAFILDAFPEKAQMVSQKCGGGHLSHKNDCDFDNTVALMKELIAN